MRQIFNCLSKASFVALVCTIFFALTSSSLHAQTITGSIGGTVTDTTGAVVPNASIEATAVDTGVVSKTTSNEAGFYAIRFLSIGNYKVVISAQGFGKKVVGPFRLEIGQDAKIDAKLAVGAASSTVEVTSDFVPLMNTENSTIASTLDSNTIESVALNGRNFSALTVFLPGAVMTSPSGMTGSNATERNTGQDGQTSVNGNRNQTNNYYLDGIEINETINNLIGYNPSPDAIGEMKVISSNAPAEYGNVNGGDVIAVTKQGNNTYHGSAFWFLENWRLDANTWANKHTTGTPLAITHYTQPMWGGTFGGPILKNKLFFFVDYESFRHPSAGSSFANVITDLMREGDFSEIQSTTQLYDNSKNSATTSATAYANNKITITNPVAKYLFAHPEYYPKANTTAAAGTVMQNNYAGKTSSFKRNDQGDVRVDYNVGAKDSIYARWLQGEASDGTTKPLIAITFPGNNSYPTKGIAFGESHTFSSNLVNEFRAGFTRVRWIIGNPLDSTGAFGTNGDSLIGLNATQPYAGFTSIEFSPNGGGWSGDTSKSATNVGTRAGNTLIVDNTFQYGDNLTWMHGHHNVKAGAEITRYQQNNYYPGNNGANGYFQYYPSYTMDVATQASGYEVADFELDAAGSIGQGGLNSEGKVAGGNGQRQYRSAYFIQDDWKYRPNLTFNIGVRYEYDQPIYEVNNKQANVNFADPSSSTLIYATTKGVKRALYDATYNNIMPRVGFNYEPNTKTVIRGGFGITNYLEGTGANLRLTYNPPFWNEVDGSSVKPTANNSGSFFSAGNGFAGGSAPTSAGATYRGWNKVKPSVVEEWSLAAEYSLTPKTNLVVAYVGESGQHLVQAVAGNQLKKACYHDGGYDLTTTGSACAAADPAPFKNLVGQNGAVVETTSGGRMTYEALQTSLRQRSTKGLEYTINYTWAHSLTNSVGFYGVSGVNGPSPYAQNAYDDKAEYGPTGMDIRHNFSGTGVYDLPFGKGRIYGNNWNRAIDEVAGGWKVAVSGVFYTGFPVTISGDDNSATGARAARPNHLRKLNVRNHSVANWFGTDTSVKSCTGNGEDNGTCAYGNTALGTFGNAAVGTERAPGFQQYDFSAYKDLQIIGAHKVTFRADFFNAFNISSYGNPQNYYKSSDFGSISSVRSVPRQIQFAAKYSF